MGLETWSRQAPAEQIVTSMGTYQHHVEAAIKADGSIYQNWREAVRKGDTKLCLLDWKDGRKEPRPNRSVEAWKEAVAQNATRCSFTRWHAMTGSERIGEAQDLAKESQ